MAAAGKGLAVPLEIEGYDPYRVYSEEPQAGAWRELRDPVSGQRYWNHVAMRLTTWSLVELLRLNGLEEFLLVGEWGVFATVPESVATYEDREWGLALFDDDRLSGLPTGKIERGTVFVSLGFPRPGVLEVLMPDKERMVVRKFAPFRAGGQRLVQRLPVREHNEDLAGLAAITVPLFQVRPQDAGEKSGASALIVTAERDPRSTELGFIRAGTAVGLASILGTRAQLARVPAGQNHLWGGWISFLLLDGTCTLERVMEDTEEMKLADQAKAELERIEAMRAAAVAAGEDPDCPAPKSRRASQVTAQASEEEPAAPTAPSRPSGKAKIPPNLGLEQRMTVTGGWRMVLDQAWTRPMYVAPIAGRLTWGLAEVLESGGLDDLLLARSWELCAVDPLAMEVMKDPEWVLRVYADSSLGGVPIRRLRKGELVVAQAFHRHSAVVMLVLPPASPGDGCAVGYASFRQRDGRPLLRAMLKQALQDDEAPEQPNALPLSHFDYPEPPDGDVLEGPYFTEPPPGQDEVAVTVGQDLGSDRWARLPRGYRVEAFAELLGFRARLPDLEGGGWVSLVAPDGTPNFRKQPSIPPAIELPGQAAALAAEEAKLPIVWPGLGVIRPPVEPPIVPVYESHLPNLLHSVGGGRALCDWHRVPLPPNGYHVWRNALTQAQARLDDLLMHQLWKIAFVEAPVLIVREGMSPASAELYRLPRGSLVIAEWVAPGALVRVLLPSRAGDPEPRHAWADLGTRSGASLSPLAPGGDFWVEPLGGHLPAEEQVEDKDAVPATVDVREGFEEGAASAGFLERGDAVQVAELRGRRARVVHTKCIKPVDSAPRGGWVDFFDESGWCLYRARFPGDSHPRERELNPPPLEEFDSPTASEEGADKPSFGMSALGLVQADDDGAAETATDSDAGLELPALLWQLGELEVKSVWTRDWREAAEPVWGQRYFVNKWSGQIVHRLSDMGVACPAVKLIVRYTNLSFAGLRQEFGDEMVEARIKNVEKALLPTVAAVADVDDDRVELKVVEDDDGGDLSEEHEDSIMSSSGRPATGGRGLRLVATIRAPGARSSWASATLRQEMADGQRFTNQMLVMMSSAPDFYSMRVDPYSDVTMQQADLEELDIPRVARKDEPPPPAPPVPPLPVAPEFVELRRSYCYTKQSVLHFHCKPVGLGDAQALATGFEGALPKTPLEELGMWGCAIGDAGTAAISKVLGLGCGANLLTLLLDENGITAAGATALGAGLAACANLQELGVSKNPLGAGFPKMLAGLGASLVILDATETGLDDPGAAAAAASLRRWGALRSLRLGGNPDIGALGVEAVARALLGAPSVKLADLQGANDEGEWPRLKRVLQDGGVDPARMRVR